MRRTGYVVLGVIALAGMSCAPRNVDRKEKVQTVKVDTVQLYGSKQNASFPGKIKAASDISLSFRVGGTIKKFHVDAGSAVKKDQILAELDPRDYQIQFNAAEAEYYKTEREVQRVMGLYREKSVTLNEYDQAVYGMQRIAQQYKVHKNALADTKLRAPYDGYVEKRFYQPDENVGAGMPVLSMISKGAPEVEINIPLADYARRDKFAGFTCALDIMPGEEFPLELISINQKANMNQLYTARLKIKEPAGDMPGPGMTAMVKIQYEPEATSMMTIPLSSVFEIKKRNEDGSLSVETVPSVWVYNPDTQTISARNITLYDVRSDGTVIISGGLVEGEIIVIAGVHSLLEGDKVKILPRASSTNVGGML